MPASLFVFSILVAMKVDGTFPGGWEVGFSPLYICHLPIYPVIVSPFFVTILRDQAYIFTFVLFDCIFVVVNYIFLSFLYCVCYLIRYAR